MNGVKILLLDDDDEVRKNLLMFFEDEGFDCFPFGNPVDALNFLDNNKAHVGIVDLRLPIMNGEEFIIEASKLNPGMKFIIYTGSADYFVSEELKKLGMKQEFVCSKPINSMDIFVDKINLLLNNE